jgi:Mn2+/Fe2+ NRAMP family transporter
LRDRHRSRRRERRRGRQGPPAREAPGPPDAAAPRAHHAARWGALRTLGLGVVTGAADDDPSAVGTYASAGAAFGTALLWTAPVVLPMMITVVYLSGKLGQVAGEGLFAVLRRHYPRWVLYPALAGVLVGNTVVAAADLGAMAAALNTVVPIPVPWIVALLTALVLALQLWGSYRVISNVLRALAMALLAYVASAVLARPDWGAVLRATLVPTVRFDREFLAILVAIVGTSLSAYIYAWHSNQEVEEEIGMGRRRLADRVGATSEELRRSWWTAVAGMCFASLVMFFIMLAAASTFHVAGQRQIESVAQAARALRPLAGNAAGALFAVGLVGVGLLAVPVLTTGAAYAVAQALGWRQGLHRTPREARRFYAAVVVFTLLALGMNAFGIDPMKALVWAAIVQGCTAPPLALLLLRMTNDRAIMGERVNGRAINVLGWITTEAMFAASVGLLVSWLR